MPDLSGLPALDVAIGLAFLYFLLSTACSAINETISNVFGWRAKTLEDGIRSLLGDPKTKSGLKHWWRQLRGKEQPGSDLTDELFAHWRIRALVRDPDSRLRRRSRPSYLPPAAFSLAVAETLAKGPPGEEPEGPSPWERGDDQILQRARDAIGQVPNEQARAVLTKAAVNAHGELEKFRSQVERAFDDSMERASGWYKRKVQVMVIVIAAVVVVGLNVDSVHVASRLWTDEPIRNAVAAKAAQASAPQGAADAVDEIDALKLPVGWGAGNAPEWGDVPASIAGWIITVAALSLGAPFWFDLLNRVAKLRGSGPPEEPRSRSHTAPAPAG